MHTPTFRIAGVRALLPTLWAVVLCHAGPASAHIIDEVAQNIVIDLKTTDAQRFDVIFALHDSHISAFYDQARQLGLPTERSDAAFERQLAAGFAWVDCRIAPSAKPAWAPKPGFRAFPMVLTCPRPMASLTLRRVDYRRDKTRTTLYIGLRIGPSAPRRMLIPPRLGALAIPVLGKGRPMPAPTTPTQAGKPDADRHESHAEGTDPTIDRPDLDDFPDPERARSSRKWASLKPPPWPILRAWAWEGAMHLAVGVDHLLFLLALVLCATTVRGLLLLVVLFSVGHMAAMFGALVLGLPGHWLIEVGIGLSIVWAGWRARSPHDTALRSSLGTLVFGLVHGWAFGSELARLVVGVDSLLWPLLSFGVGLDGAQSVFCALVYVAWKAVVAKTPPSRTETARNVVAGAVILGGLAFSVVAAVG